MMATRLIVARPDYPALSLLPPLPALGRPPSTAQTKRQRYGLRRSAHLRQPMASGSVLVVAALYLCPGLGQRFSETRCHRASSCVGLPPREERRHPLGLSARPIRSAEHGHVHPQPEADRLALAVERHAASRAYTLLHIEERQRIGLQGVCQQSHHGYTPRWRSASAIVRARGIYG
jgi:hypothetical protein